MNEGSCFETSRMVWGCVNTQLPSPATGREVNVSSPSLESTSTLLKGSLAPQRDWHSGQSESPLKAALRAETCDLLERPRPRPGRLSGPRSSLPSFPVAVSSHRPLAGRPPPGVSLAEDLVWPSASSARLPRNPDVSS